jgi:hypothetical protein
MNTPITPGLDDPHSRIAAIRNRHHTHIRIIAFTAETAGHFGAFSTAPTMSHYKGAASEGDRAANLMKERERSRAELDAAKRKLEEGTKKGSMTKFDSGEGNAAEIELKQTTYGPSIHRPRAPLLGNRVSYCASWPPTCTLGQRSETLEAQFTAAHSCLCACFALAATYGPTFALHPSPITFGMHSHPLRLGNPCANESAAAAD